MKNRWVVIDIRLNDGTLEVKKRNETDGVVSDWHAVRTKENLSYEPRRLPKHRRKS